MCFVIDIILYCGMAHHTMTQHNKTTHYTSYYTTTQQTTTDIAKYTLYTQKYILYSSQLISTPCRQTHTDRDQPIMLIFYPLCYAAVLKNLAYYARYYAQEQEFC